MESIVLLRYVINGSAFPIAKKHTKNTAPNTKVKASKIQPINGLSINHIFLVNKCFNV